MERKLEQNVSDSDGLGVSTILMIRPVRFGYNAETAKTNAFQNIEFAKNDEVTTQELALLEFDGLVAKLRAVGVHVIVVQDTVNPHTPDSIFPNNWVSFHEDGTMVTYPMEAKNRRLERNLNIENEIEKKFIIENHYPFEMFERDNWYLEGTGSMVLDRKNKIAYACLSPRTHLNILTEWGRQLEYNIVHFDAVDANGKQIYHTNVLMCIAEHFAVICLAAISNLDQRHFLEEKLEKTGKEIIEISMEQMNSFAGNMLEVIGSENNKYVVMSSAAYNFLTHSQIADIEKFGTIIYSDLTTIEGNGGGSARCMMAEVNLPLRQLKR